MSNYKDETDQKTLREEIHFDSIRLHKFVTKNGVSTAGWGKLWDDW